MQAKSDAWRCTRCYGSGDITHPSHGYRICQPCYLQGYVMMMEQSSEAVISVPQESVHFEYGVAKTLDRDGNVIDLVVVPGTST